MTNLAIASPTEGHAEGPEKMIFRVVNNGEIREEQINLKSLVRVLRGRDSNLSHPPFRLPTL